MRVYAFYEKISGVGYAADEHVMLVKEGFCWPALFFFLIWPLYHRFWLITASLLCFSVGAIIVLYCFHGGEAWLVLGLVALALISGAEGNNLRQYDLTRRGYSFSGVVAGRDEREAELRLFAVLDSRGYLP